MWFFQDETFFIFPETFLKNQRNVNQIFICFRRYRYKFDLQRKWHCQLLNRFRMTETGVFMLSTNIQLFRITTITENEDGKMIWFMTSMLFGHRIAFWRILNIMWKVHPLKVMRVTFVWLSEIKPRCFQNVVTCLSSVRNRVDVLTKTINACEIVFYCP